MNTLIKAAALVLAMAGPGFAQQEQTEIQAVIDRQLEAFNARDADTAFEDASDTIRRIFGSSTNFARMVEQGYPMVWSNSEARYLDLRNLGGVWWQKVLIRDAMGVPHVLEYKMIETAAGWRVDGVAILAAPELAA